MKIFISWSGSVSHRIALQLRDWLPVVLPFAEPWVSSEDIPKGSRWGTELASELEATDCGLVCVTPDNIAEPWLNFEAGALSKSVVRGQVHPFLVGVVPGDLRGPLAQFQVTRFDKDDVRRMVRALNSSAEGGGLPEERIERNLAICWPDLERRLAPLLTESTALPYVRGDRENGHEVATADALIDDELAVLRLILAEDGDSVLPKDAAMALDMRPERARHLMERLQAKGFLHSEENALYGMSWSLSPHGRAFLVENGLL